MCLCRVLALSFMGTNGMRSFLQSWVKGRGLPQLYLGVEILVIMVMLWSLCMGGLMGLLASSDQYGVFWSSGRNLSWEVLILTVLVTFLALLLPIFTVQVSFISSYPHSTYFHTICHQTIYRKCMCFLLSKIQCLGFWINNGMEKCYWCSCFSCTHMGESDGREWKRWSWTSQFAKYSEVMRRHLQVRAQQTAVLNNHIQHKVTFSPSC